MKITVFYNDKSGSGDKLLLLQKAFKFNGAHTIKYVPISKLPKEIVVAKEHNSLIAVAGGDGSVSSVAAAAVKHGLRLGVIAAGTLNHFAKDLNLPGEFAQAVKVILDGEAKKVDVASVNNHVFINNASIGIYPTIVKEREKHSTYLGKWPAAFVALIKAMTKMRRHHVTLEAEDQTYHFRTPFLFVGNNSYHIRKFGFTNRNDLTKGKLSVYWITTKNPFRIGQIFMRALLGKAHRDRDFASLQTTALRVRLRRQRITVAYDGEVKTFHSPLHFKSHPAALSVMMPVGLAKK